jgi:hypothetical protein
MDSDTRSLIAAVAARSGSNTNPLMQKILAQNGLNPESATNIDNQDLITKLGEKDPTLALIAQQLLQSKENLDALESDDAEDAEKELEKPKEMGRAFHKFRQKVELMYAELEQLRNKNDSLAAALGACYLCWGNDPLCEVCGGSGHSGAFEPDRELFAELIVPALRKIRKSSPKAEQKQLHDHNLNSKNNKESELEKGEKS